MNSKLIQKVIPEVTGPSPGAWDPNPGLLDLPKGPKPGATFVSLLARLSRSQLLRDPLPAQVVRAWLAMRINALPPGVRPPPPGGNQLTAGKGKGDFKEGGGLGVDEDGGGASFDEWL